MNCFTHIVDVFWSPPPSTYHWWPQLAPELHHGTTMQGGHGSFGRPRPSPRQLQRLTVAVVSLRCLLLGFAELWWMDGCGGWRRQRQFIKEHLGQRGREPSSKWAGSTILGRPSWARFGPALPPRCFSRFLEFMSNYLWVLDDVFPRFG
jgi:hypothetical protein